jgi:8-oxo-dGTP diphosphatase
MSKQPGVDAFVIFNRKILLIQRDSIQGIQNPGKWNLPGGGIENGETELQALARELKEEINLDLRDAEYLDTTSYEDGNLVSKYWVKINEEEKAKLTLGEGQRMDFFELEEVSRLDIIPNLQSYLKEKQSKIEALIN